MSRKVSAQRFCGMLLSFLNDHAPLSETICQCARLPDRLRAMSCTWPRLSTPRGGMRQCRDCIYMILQPPHHLLLYIREGVPSQKALLLWGGAHIDCLFRQAAYQTKATYTHTLGNTESDQ